MCLPENKSVAKSNIERLIAALDRLSVNLERDHAERERAVVRNYNARQERYVRCPWTEDNSYSSGGGGAPTNSNGSGGGQGGDRG